jgi:hypothetical protein
VDVRNDLAIGAAQMTQGAVVLEDQGFGFHQGVKTTEVGLEFVKVELAPKHTEHLLFINSPTTGQNTAER